MLTTLTNGSCNSIVKSDSTFLYPRLVDLLHASNSTIALTIAGLFLQNVFSY